MTKRKWITITMGLLVLTLTGCTNQTADNTMQSADEVDTQSPYEAFVEKIQSENLWDYGIDIVSMLDEHLSQYYSSSTGDQFLTADNITDISYILERCNLSKKDGSSFNDMVVGIDIIKDAPLGAGLNSMHVFYAFILNENGQMDTVLDEVVTGRESDLKYELLDVTGDGSDEIILTKTIGRQIGRQRLINMLAWVPEQNGMSMIFDEKLFFCTYPCDCENNYQLVPAQTGRGYDIMFFSEIFYIKTDILGSVDTNLT